MRVRIGFITARTSTRHAVRHAALEAAGAVGAAEVPALGGVEDLVVGLAARHPPELEAGADLDALDGLDAQEGLADAPVQAGVAAHVRAEPGERVEGPHLEHAAEGVVVLAGGLDGGLHALGRLGVEASHRALVDALEVLEGEVVAERRPPPAPMRTTWLRISMPKRRSSALATPPAATRAAVSRALARSRIGRRSPVPYLSIPARSACPGRGSVIGATSSCGVPDRHPVLGPSWGSRGWRSRASAGCRSCARAAGPDFTWTRSRSIFIRPPRP